jgi:hypothetical protein
LEGEEKKKEENISDKRFRNIDTEMSTATLCYRNKEQGPKIGINKFI